MIVCHRCRCAVVNPTAALPDGLTWGAVMSGGAIVQADKPPRAMRRRVIVAQNQPSRTQRATRESDGQGAAGARRCEVSSAGVWLLESSKSNEVMAQLRSENPKVLVISSSALESVCEVAETILPAEWSLSYLIGRRRLAIQLRSGVMAFIILGCIYCGLGRVRRQYLHGVSLRSEARGSRFVASARQLRKFEFS